MSLGVSLTDPTATYKVEDLYWGNITHNLGKMAEAAGIYKHLWYPEELGIKHAKELIEPLREGLEKLKNNPDYYKKFNSPNGWGKYENFVRFVEKYLIACEEYPEAIVEADR